MLKILSNLIIVTWITNSISCHPNKCVAHAKKQQKNKITHLTTIKQVKIVFFLKSLIIHSMGKKYYYLR